MRKECILLSLVVLLSFNSQAQTAADTARLYQRFQFIQGGDTLPYRLLLPLNYDSSKTYPLVLFLHGRGESGRDNEAQLTYVRRFFLTDSLRRKHPAIIVLPQCPANSYWSNVQTIADSNGRRVFYFVPDGEASGSMRLLMGLTDNLPRQFHVNKTQVSVMGMSMGGMGVYELVRRRPAVFASAIAICGGADPSTARTLTGTRWWLFHGEKDNVVPTIFSRNMAAALKQTGADVKLTLYPDADHNSWDRAFAEPGLMDWLFSAVR